MRREKRIADLLFLIKNLVDFTSIGMLTPPMGICLIVSSSISGDPIGAVSRRVIPFLIVLIIDLLIITFYSPLTMWMAGLITN